jgi:hypothetical protein
VRHCQLYCGIAHEVFEEYFRPHIVEGAACTEAGDQAFRVHLQCMFLMMISSSDDVEDTLKEFLLDALQMNEAEQFRVCVRDRVEDGGNISRDRQIGYVAKDYGKRHFQIVYLQGITEQELRQYGMAYQQVRGHNVFIKETYLGPFDFAWKMVKWEHANIYPLNYMVTTVQVVRWMLLSGKYSLSSRWVSAGYRGCVADAVLSYRRLCYNLRRYNEVDITDVAMVMSRGTAELNEGNRLELVEGEEMLNTMSVEDVRRRARCAMRR